MGFFSWKTMDTDRSIANTYSNVKTFRVYMTDNTGNIWTENQYDGYGRFGGKDYYELLAEMNGFVSEKYQKGTEEYTDEARGFGISLAFSKDNHSGNFTEGVFYPNLIETIEGWVYDMKGPESCEYQGYFFDETDYEDEEEEDEDY